MLCLGHFDEEFAHTAHGKHGANNKKKKVNNIIICIFMNALSELGSGDGERVPLGVETLSFNL